MIPTLRVLTLKSKLGFGKKKEYTVEQLIKLNKKLQKNQRKLKLLTIFDL